MRLLLTADLHLKSDEPERLQALEEILSVAETQDADYLLIAGDLFDANVDVEDVKPEIRDLFSENSFQTYAIPGNHDQNAFREEDYFGPDIELLKETPYQQKELGPVNLVAVPYFEGEFTDIIDQLGEATEKDAINILLIHCTLAGFGGGFGNESRYLPITPEDLLQLPYDYVFSGHIHSSPTKKEISDQTVFVYPGSPVSITRSETGTRGVWLLDTDNTEDPLTNVDLDTFHYENIQLNLRPGNTETELANLERRLSNKNLENAHLILDLNGFIEQEEESFFDQLETILEEAEPRETEIDDSQLRSVKSIVETSLYQKFKEKLEEQDDMDTEAVEKIGLEAYARHDRA